jgi:hypothetical protein
MAIQIVSPATVPDEGDKELAGVVEALIVLAPGTKLHLYQSTFAPGSHNTAADFAAAECSFTGYAAATLTVSVAGLGADENWQYVSVRAFIQATDAVTPQLAGGAWIEDGAGKVLAFFPFPNPMDFTFANAFGAFTVTFGYREPWTLTAES